jgi:hypothetical protein
LHKLQLDLGLNPIVYDKAKEFATSKLLENYDTSLELQEQIKRLMITTRDSYSDDNIYYNYIRNSSITDLMLKNDKKSDYSTYLNRLIYAHLEDDITSYYLIIPYLREYGNIDEDKTYYTQVAAKQLEMDAGRYVRNKYYTVPVEMNNLTDTDGMF